MKQYNLLIFISSLLLFSLTFGCTPSLSKKTHKKSNIAGVTVDDQNASVEIREKMVFREEELQNIIPPIISAFSMANSFQDILVYSSLHKDLLVDTRSYFSMFMTNNELNIVFSTIKNKKSSIGDARAIQMGTYSRSNKTKFKDPLDVKRSSRWSLVPMEGQRLASGRQNWLIIDFTYYGHSNLFGRDGSDNVGDNISH
jgi:hypothetical protein